MSTDEGAAVFVFHGAANGIRVGAPDVIASPWIETDVTPGSDFGSVMAAGDFDGDGFSDLAMATPSRARVVVHRGGPFGLEASAAWVIEGRVVHSLTAADVDGDGASDLWLGSEEALLLYRGDMAAAVLEVPAAAGTPAVSAGDVDGDGFADIALAGTGASALTLVLGAADAAAIREVSVALPAAVATTVVTLRRSTSPRSAT